MKRNKPPRRTITGGTNVVESLLNLLADIRNAVGDPHGKLMQDELVEHCRQLRDNRGPFINIPAILKRDLTSAAASVMVEVPRLCELDEDTSHALTIPLTVRECRAIVEISERAELTLEKGGQK